MGRDFTGDGTGRPPGRSARDDAAHRWRELGQPGRTTPPHPPADGAPPADAWRDDGSRDDGWRDDDGPVDLSALAAASDAAAGAARWEALAARIERAAEPELARRARAGADFAPVLARSLRPALVAAAAALLLSVGLSRADSGEPAPSAAPAGDLLAGPLLSDASADRVVPAGTEGAAWVEEQHAPDAGALAEAIGLEWAP
jgi:hypothetical protein